MSEHCSLKLLCLTCCESNVSDFRGSLDIFLAQIVLCLHSWECFVWNWYPILVYQNFDAFPPSGWRSKVIVTTKRYGAMSSCSLGSRHLPGMDSIFFSHLPHKTSIFTFFSLPLPIPIPIPIKINQIFKLESSINPSRSMKTSVYR
jgi:hypothetical protein